MEDIDYSSADDFDDDEPLDSIPEEDEVLEEVEEDVYVPYNIWYKETNEHIESMTNFVVSIESVGFENDWHDMWMEGTSPAEAALRGVLGDDTALYLLMKMDEESESPPKGGARYGP